MANNTTIDVSKLIQVAGALLNAIVQPQAAATGTAAFTPTPAVEPDKFYRVAGGRCSRGELQPGVIAVIHKDGQRIVCEYAEKTGQTEKNISDEQIELVPGVVFEVTKNDAINYIKAAAAQRALETVQDWFG